MSAKKKNMSAKKKKCETKYCRNIALKYRKVCAKCRTKKWRKENPIKNSYNILKTNAKRRNKGFDITFQEFKKFCEETNYIELKGIHREDLTIDRKNHKIGYTYSNMRVLIHYQNDTNGYWEGQGQEPPF